MTHPPSRAFDLPGRLAGKADPALIATDEEHFARIESSLQRSIAELARRLEIERRAPGGTGQAAMDRDMEVHRITARLRTLRRHGIDLCLGHMVGVDDTEPVYIGRLGLSDDSGRDLLIDWRSPAAEPFFGATHADPMGLRRRRRYRWTTDRITDYWDEVFAESGVSSEAALDDQSAFIASLGASRSPRMRDVLSTIASDQDAIIRAGSQGALVVDGGPGTGKTVVALHRTAYLLYSDPRLARHRGGVLFIGPHEPYLAYVGDVLPSLGEESVQTATLRELVAEGASAVTESDARVARLKSHADMVAAIDAAVDFYEQPPTTGMQVETDWGDAWLTTDDWAAAFAAPETGTPHNEARDAIREQVTEILLDRLGDVRRDELGDSLRRDRDLTDRLNRSWPVIEAADLVGDLWTVPAYLRLCAPWLRPDEVDALQRSDPRAWTDADVPLLDAARRRLGDPDASRRLQAQRRAVGIERSRRASVVDDLVAAHERDTDGDGESTSLVTMLRGGHLHDVLVDEAARPTTEPDLLLGPFAHIVVDEAQELTDAQWSMLVARCPSRSFTIVGDRAQARHGFPETWPSRLARMGIDRVDVASLRINYRTPQEVMSAAEPVIRTALPDANVPISVRSNGVPVTHGIPADLDAVLARWLADTDDGIACVIGDPAFIATPRIRSSTPEMVKGLEFDLVVLVDPRQFGGGVDGAVDRYVAMTRATQQLVILESP